MTPVPANITVDFNSNYTGDHRVCWRMGISGPYDCSTIVNCAGGGAACQAVIVISVDNETCDNVDFNGYVQATCNDIGSLEGRIPFQSTFIPEPTCKPYLITCDSSSIASISILNGGSGYDPLPTPPPIITFLGGGIGAAATATVTDGGLLTWNSPGQQGQGYNPGVYFNVPFTTIAGPGSGAIASQVTVDGGGNIDSVNVILDPANPGSGYTLASTISLDAAALGGSMPTQAFVTDVLTVDTGRIYMITLDAPGTGYTVGSATIAPPAMGITATVTVELAPCIDFLLTQNCSAQPPVTLMGMEVGQNFTQCLTAEPGPVDGYSIAPGMTCCYECSQVLFTVGLEPVTIHYTDCNTQEVVTVNAIASQVVGPVCAVNDTWWYSDEDETVTIDVTPGCP